MTKFNDSYMRHSVSMRFWKLMAFWPDSSLMPDLNTRIKTSVNIINLLNLQPLLVYYVWSLL